MYTKKINKIAPSSNDDKRLQAFNRIIGANAFKICESEMLSKYEWLILMIIQMKIKQNIIKSGHIFQIIHTEY